MPKETKPLSEAEIKARDDRELVDPFTGVAFIPRSRNHYEQPDPVPFAPPLSIQRPTVRQRIENLIVRGVDPLADFIRQRGEPDDLDFEVPDDPEAPLTASEQNHLDMLASEIAEQAPLPDDGLPRPQSASPASQPQAGDTPGGGGSPADGGPPKAASAGPLPADPKSVPTR